MATEIFGLSGCGFETCHIRLARQKTKIFGIDIPIRGKGTALCFSALGTMTINDIADAAVNFKLNLAA